MNVKDHKDWKDGIDPTEEDRARFERVRGYLQECREIVENLFPEDVTKPPSTLNQQKRWQSETRKEVGTEVGRIEEPASPVSPGDSHDVMDGAAVSF